MTPSPRCTPVRLEKKGDGDVEIAWEDGVVTPIPGELLRLRCPCAQCIEEWTGRLMVRPDQARGVGVRRMEQVGDYAFTIAFSDGHATGIFTYARLRELGEEAAGTA